MFEGYKVEGNFVSLMLLGGVDSVKCCLPFLLRMETTMIEINNAVEWTTGRYKTVLFSKRKDQHSQYYFQKAYNKFFEIEPYGSCYHL